MYDSSTKKIGFSLTDVFEILSKILSRDYGGIMQHLWIDFELVEQLAKPDGTPKYPFRFAKRVS